MSSAKPMNKPSCKPKHSSNVIQQLSDSDYEEPEERRSKPILLYTGHTSPDGYGYIEDHEDNASDNASDKDASDNDASDDASYDDDSYAEEDTEYISDEELYTLSSDEQEPMSSILPTYEAEISGTTRKMLIDTGASSVYVSRRLVNELGLKTTKVKSRRIKVADDNTKVVNRITTIDVKLGNLPVETLTAYVFPLKDLDLVLGYPWLKKHNPHTDWKTRAHEFTRNGRRYMLYPPSTKPSKLRVVDPEEFRTFINEDPESTEIAHLPLIDVGANNGDDVPSPQKDIGRQTPRQERRELEREKEKMILWIKEHRKRPLRPIGKPAKLRSWIQTWSPTNGAPAHPLSPRRTCKRKQVLGAGRGGRRGRRQRKRRRC